MLAADYGQDDAASRLAAIRTRRCAKSVKLEGGARAGVVSTVLVRGRIAAPSAIAQRCTASGGAAAGSKVPAPMARQRRMRYNCARGGLG